MEANTVAYNGLDGFLDVTDYNFAVGLTPQGHQGNLLTENSIHSNGRLGINLRPPNTAPEM